jgi:hypothetical protein
MALVAMFGSVLQLVHRTRFLSLPEAMSSPAVEPPFSVVTMMDYLGLFPHDPPKLPVMQLLHLRFTAFYSGTYAIIPVRLRMTALAVAPAERSHNV